MARKWRVGTKKLQFVNWVHNFSKLVEPPFTVRQVFYQLLAEKILTKKTKKSYDYLDDVLTDARRDKLIPIEWFEDEDRVPSGDVYFSVIDSGEFFKQNVESYEGALDRFKDSGNNYFYHRWEGQPNYVEVWYEKRALTKQFERAVKGLGVLLQVCRGTSSFTAIWQGSIRFQNALERGVCPLLLYFGDMDPTGWSNLRWIQRELESTFNVVGVKYIRCAVTLEQISGLGLVTKEANRRDSRYPLYKQNVGDIQADLEAIHPNVLRDIIQESVGLVFDEVIYQEKQKELGEIRSSLQEQIEEYLG